MRRLGASLVGIAQSTSENLRKINYCTGTVRKRFMIRIGRTKTNYFQGEHAGSCQQADAIKHFFLAEAVNITKY